jgi:hypothetical protein
MLTPDAQVDDLHATRSAVQNELAEPRFRSAFTFSSPDGTQVYAQGALRADREGWAAQARLPSLDTSAWTTS